MRYLKMQVYTRQMHCVVVEIGGPVGTEFANKLNRNNVNPSPAAFNPEFGEVI
jgi:hypothetical protein